MLRELLAWGLALGSMVALGGAFACNLNTSGMGGEDSAMPVDPSSTGASTSTSTGPEATDGPEDPTTSTASPVDGTTTTSTSEATATDSTTSAASTTDSDPLMTVEYCDMPNVTIPQAPQPGLTSTIDVPDDGTVVEVRVVVRADHTFAGDLTFELRKDGIAVMVMENPGMGMSHCSGDNINVVLRDDASVSIDEACLEDGEGPPPALSGEARPDNPLAPFVGEPSMGSWDLTALDTYSMDDGRFVEWCVQIDYQ